MQTTKSKGRIYLTIVYLVRHGQTVLSEKGQFCGRTDPDLSAGGAQNVRALAGWLAGESLPAQVFTSPLLRARQTARLLEAAWPPPAIEPRLRESDFGDWEGLDGDELQAHDPAGFAAWIADPVGFRPPGGESVGELCERVAEFFQEALERFADQTIAAVCHGGPIRAMVLAGLGLPLECFWHFNPPWASVSRLEVRGPVRQLRYFGQRG